MKTDAAEKTDFEEFLGEQKEDAEFRERFQQAGEEWNLAIQLAELRHKAGISQRELARRLRISRQQISRLESASYQGHTLSSLRKVASALGLRVRVVFEPIAAGDALIVSQRSPKYSARKKSDAEKARRKASGNPKA